MMRAVRIVVVVIVGVLSAHPAAAGFGGTEVYLPSVGRGPGVAPSQWYTTVWVSNPNPQPVNVTFTFLERDTVNTSPSGYAGNFNGRIQVNGDLSVSGTKNFCVDHPLQPGRVLVHAAVESSEVLNVYSGNVRLDGDGSAVVELPAWFEAVNTDLRYQLTAIGAAAPGLYIAEEVAGNRFQIAGGLPGIKVSWLVTAVRNDPYMMEHPFEAERDAPEAAPSVTQR